MVKKQIPAKRKGMITNAQCDFIFDNVIKPNMVQGKINPETFPSIVVAYNKDKYVSVYYGYNDIEVEHILDNFNGVATQKWFYLQAVGMGQVWKSEEKWTMKVMRDTFNERLKILVYNHMHNIPW